jgi:AbrB family looped-hinge helix DNA binding protein
MNSITTITSKGQVTIPSHIRASLDVKPGDKAIFKHASSNKKEVTISIIPSKSTVEKLAGSLHRPGMKYIPIKEARRLAGLALAKKYGVTPKK